MTCLCMSWVSDCVQHNLVVQVTERTRGNQHYRQKQFDIALAHYDNARLVLEPLKGCPAEEQQEVDTNLVKVYLNMAAVYLFQQLFSAAIAWCSKALAMDPRNEKALMRRARAHVGRHNYQVCFLSSHSHMPHAWGDVLKQSQ